MIRREFDYQIRDYANGKPIEEIPGASYRNGNEVAHDIVTDVPYYVPPLLAYVHDRPLTMVCCPPPPGSDLGIFAWHDSNLYVGALKGTSK